MIYDNNFSVDNGVMMEADLTAHPVYAQYEIMSECINTEHAIFMKMMDQDFAECYNKHNPSVMTESNLEAIQEASVGDIFKRVKDFIIKIGKKLMGILDNIIARIKMLCTKDGKDIVNKYGKRAHTNFNSGKMSDVKFKWRKRKSYEIKDFKGSDLNNKYTNALKIAEGFVKTGGSKAANDAGLTEAHKDKITPYTDSDKKDLKEGFLGYLAGTSTDEKSFKADLMETFLDDEDTIEGSQFDLGEAERILKDFSKAIENTNKAKRVLDREIKDLRKVAEDLEKVHTKALGSADAKFYNKVANCQAGKAIAICSIFSSSYAAAYSVLLDSYKAEYKYAKNGFIKCATFGGKKSVDESALYEEIANYEVDVLLA